MVRDAYPQEMWFSGKAGGKEPLGTHRHHRACGVTVSVASEGPEGGQGGRSGGGGGCRAGSWGVRGRLSGWDSTWAGERHPVC